MGVVNFLRLHAIPSRHMLLTRFLEKCRSYSTKKPSSLVNQLKAKPFRAGVPFLHQLRRHERPGPWKLAPWLKKVRRKTLVVPCCCRGPLPSIDYMITSPVAHVQRTENRPCHVRKLHHLFLNFLSLILRVASRVLVSPCFDPHGGSAFLSTSQEEKNSAMPEPNQFLSIAGSPGPPTRGASLSIFTQILGTM